MGGMRVVGQEDKESTIWLREMALVILINVESGVSYLPPGVVEGI